MTIDRRSFLSRAAATSLAAAFPLELGRAHAPLKGRSADEWDLSWPSKLRGKVRGVFDSPGVNDGVALFRAAMWREQLHDVYGTPKEEITPVIVFRHQGIVLVMNDEYWDRFGVGKRVKQKDEKAKKWAKKNPVASAPESYPAPFNEISLPKFIANGGIVLGCGLAFQQVVGEFKKKDKLDAAAAKKAALDHMIPGVILQPSGFFAVLKAQDEGCNFMMGS